jgi:hypothetical protein
MLVVIRGIVRGSLDTLLAFLGMLGAVSGLCLVRCVLWGDYPPFQPPDIVSGVNVSLNKKYGF